MENPEKIVKLKGAQTDLREIARAMDYIGLTNGIERIADIIVRIGWVVDSIEEEEN
jgi:hypothetical protein